MKPKPKKTRSAPGYVPVPEEEVAQQLKVFRRLQEFSDANPEHADEMSDQAIQFACQSPTVMLHVCEALITALAKGIEANGEEIDLGDQKFRDRQELKVWCSKILKLYKDGDPLQPKDAQKMLELLSFHPKGAAKAQGCVGMRTGMHPSGKMRCFYVVREASEEDFSYMRCVDNAPTFEVRSQVRVLRALAAILEVNPTARKTFSETVAERFPLTKGLFRKVSKHRNWVGALLTLCSRNMSVFTEYLPIVVVRHVVQVDSEMAREGQIEPRGEEDSIADILDCTMMVFFEFLQKHLTPPATTPMGEKVQQDLVYTMLYIFNTVILHTPKVRCVQFLWFYIASLRPQWAEAFLRLLIEVASHHTETLEKRLLAYSYAASFLARAQFLNAKYAVKTSEFISVVGRELLQAVETCTVQPSEIHLLLASVQAQCYIIVWWAEGFLQEVDEDGVNALEKVLPEYGQPMTAMAFTPLLSSSHKPIAHINRAVAREFCRSIRPWRPKLAELLAQQLREVHPAGQKDEMTLKGSGFFPYDPYPLAHSIIFLNSIYRSWSGEEDAQTEVSKPRTGSASSAASEMEDVDFEDFTDDADVASRGFTPLVGPSPFFRPGESMDMEMAVSPVFGPSNLLPQSMEEDFEALPSAAIDTDESSFLSQRLSSEAYRLQVA